MSRDCGQCDALRAQLNQANAEINRLSRIVDELRQRLGGLVAGLRALARFIDREQTEPTMPRQRLIPTVLNRLELLRDEAEGRY